MAKLSLQEVVGKGYADFWKFKGRYRVVKGSRSSKKSVTMALWSVWNIMATPGANMLVVRKTYRTLKDSCFTQLKWACNRLGVMHMWKFTENPLEAVYLPTRQHIYFRGLDDSLKITSITCETGSLCWMWIEEAYEIMNENDFDIVDESIRGGADGIYKQVTLTFNPWNEKHWIKRRFFDVQDPDIFAMTTNYTCNEWLDEQDLKVFENMRLNNPRRYQVAGLGNWGVVEGLVYENWIEREYELKDVRQCKTVAGLDFGYTNDPSALFIGFIDTNQKKLYVWDEMYEKGLSNREIAIEIKKMGYGKERIVADSSEPKSIDELKYLGLRVKGAKKGKDSILNGIQYIQDFQIIIHPRCVNFLTEINNYSWDEDKFGNKLNKPVDDFNHLMDAMRYACEGSILGNGWQMSNRKLL